MECSALFLSSSDHHLDPTSDPRNLKHMLSAPGLKDDNLDREKFAFCHGHFLTSRCTCVGMMCSILILHIHK